MPEPRCALQSLEVAEPLWGTAPHHRGWLFLEVPGPWGARLLAQSHLPPETKAWLRDLRRETGLRLSFLRREGATPPPWRAFLWLSGPAGETCARWDLPTLEALRALPLRAWVAGERPLPAAARCTEPAYLVCVNAQRDACCGHFGPRLYRALQDLRPAHAWMTTHIGGHRFAPNLLVLPQGLVYGRVRSAEDAAAVVQALERGEVHLGLLRGRVALPPPAQAAEHLLRLHTGERALGAFSLAWLREVAARSWEAAFLGPHHRAFLIHLRRQNSPLRRLPACRAAKPLPVSFFAFQDLQTYPLRRYRAAGGVVVDPHGRVLVLLRPAQREVRLPKGHIEPGEDAWATARREIAEEAGLPSEALRPLAHLGTAPVGFLHQGTLVWRHEQYFLVRWQGGRSQPPEAQFIPLWLTWPQAEQALTFAAERAWLRRAQAAYRRATGGRPEHIA